MRCTSLLAALLLLAACGDDSGSPGATPSPGATSAAPSASATASGPVELRAIDYSFSPRTLTIPVGTTLTVRNAGQDTHTFTSKPGQVTTFDVDLGAAGSRGTVTFGTAGTVEYVCSVHEARGMVGTIVVTA